MAIYCKSVVTGITPSQEKAGWTQGTFLSSLNGWNFYAFGFFLEFSKSSSLKYLRATSTGKGYCTPGESTFNRTVVDQIAVIRWPLSKRSSF